MPRPTHIRVRNARTHNLQGVDVDVPRNRLVVFTGVSGSGKSSLAHDTIFMEGQRRFVESLSAYARQFIGQLERPPVDAVEGVSPTLSIDQKTVNRNPRSTVGTVTELTDHIRLLMARLGTPACPECGRTVSRLSVGQIANQLVGTAGGAEQLVGAQRLLGEVRGQRAIVLGPAVRERKGEYRKELAQLLRDGWVRARIDGTLCELESPPTLARYEKHTIEVVVDRLRLELAERSRLVEALERAARIGKGAVVVHLPESERDLTFSTERGCPDHPEVAFPELEPRLFSFNAPQGACPDCNGLGALEQFDASALLDGNARVPDAFRAFNEDGKLPFAHFDRDTLLRVCALLGAPVGTPVGRWPEPIRDKLLHGDPALTWTTELDREDRSEVRQRAWKGLLPMVETVWHYTSWPSLAPFRTSRPCPGCGGQRLHRIARAVTFRGQNVPALVSLSVGESLSFFHDVRLEGSEKDVGEQILVEIRGRLEFLREVGLGYLTLDRSAATLSGGESQRIRLAAQVGSALEGVTYVLDEPSIGLHPRDNRRLLGALERLRDRGNSVLVVEHDAETILAADYVVDVGPGAGRSGGRICAVGSPRELMSSKTSPTARWLRGEERIAVPARRRKPTGWLHIEGATANNLRGADVRLPLGCLVVVTGVSGSGKSSLVTEVIEPTVRHRRPVACARVRGLDAIDKLVQIDQTPIGRTPRSNPATYTGVFDPIRDLFAATPEARVRGYKKGRFSFNVSGGRCASCEGAGVRLVEMQFLPPVEVTCEVCSGQRFNAETLEIRWKGLNVTDVLRLTVAEALETFAAVPRIGRTLRTLVDVGLGYLPLGQPSTTLSGGEAQRIKLATELQRTATGRTLYLLDEPTTGLHFSDVWTLLAALQRLVEGGNTVVVVEHHTDVIKVADQIVDLGPEGGDAGGQIVGQGTPEAIARLDTPTGRVLAERPEVAGGALAHDLPPRGTVPRAVEGPGELTVRGARLHNLRAIDVVIPHNQLTVITGVSGSGKTSLAFDTIFAEGQRQYVESLSTYARRFLGRVERAPVDRIEGLQPAIAIDQRSGGHNPRSTVATVTEIHDVLRLLYARIGTPHCPRCGRAIHPRAPSQAAAFLRASAPGPGWLLARLAASPDPEIRRNALVHEGWTRLVGDVELTDPRAVALLSAGTELVIDRFSPEKTALTRVAEALESAYRIGGGSARFVPRSGAEPIGVSAKAECAEHGIVLEGELTPRHFSFNARLGACPRCDGVGVTSTIDPDRLLPNRGAPLWEAIDPRIGSVLARSARNRALVEAVLAQLGVSADDPVRSWPAGALAAVLEGIAEPVNIRWSKTWGTTTHNVEERKPWPGLLSVLDGWQSRLSWLVHETVCPKCNGARLRPELLAVTICDRSIAELTAMSVEQAADEIGGWALTGAAATIAERPLDELVARLGFLCDVGLGYLSLDRSATTLSGGESQRIRLASQLGAGLCAVTYVLDEPTVGLHAADTERLMGTLEGLRDQGNTVLLVEHDLDVIHRADHVIDLGPAAGIHGGMVLAAGSPQELMAHPGSVTGRWLAGIEVMPVRSDRRAPRSWMHLRDPRGHNLCCGDVDVPTGVWVGVSGVSGSGKSTLVMETLAPALQAQLGAEVFGASHGGLRLQEAVDRVVVVDQGPLGRTPRSTPATYTKLLDPLRALFAEVPLARERGWQAGRFSFNSAEGRCPICEGRGATLVEMHFLPDVWVTCDACGGKRYDPSTLEVRWQGKSIADVLAMRADEALELFARHRTLSRVLTALVDVGLGYLTLGQPANTLSGGEAQRVKLAAELGARKGHVVYVLDEPTTGLHMADVARLVDVLHRLVDRGHTVITIEHHLGILAQADWILDLGPEGGAGGGRLVGEGSPEQVARLDTPTGRALRREFDRARRSRPVRRKRS